MKASSYIPVLPFDQKILELLPKEGELAFGLYPKAESVPNIGKQLGGVDSSIISTRMRLLHAAGFVVTVLGVPKAGGKASWQITPRGEELLRGWSDNGASSDVGEDH